MEIQKLAVIGAGLMGHGIAQVAAQAGLQVRLRDVEEGRLQRAMASIEKSLGRFVKAGSVAQEEVPTILGRIQPTLELGEAAANADYVIEAVPEDLELKKQVFAELDSICPPHTILATNTSQLSITAIAAATKRPPQVIGTHWFSPPAMMKLIEVVKGLETSQETLDTTLALAQRLGKETVVCKDSRGFITSRAFGAFMAECVRILEEGIASPEDIDKAIKLGFNHPMGPFQLMDFGGLDVAFHAMSGLEEVFGPRFKPPQILRTLVSAGYLGPKTGRGFYSYDKK
jgi:3-hydroxybutyryl-CoA dehydrogenase